MRALVCIASVLIMAMSFNAYAFKDLGVHGKTYPVVENDFYEWLMSKLEEKGKNFTPPSKEDVRRMVEKKLIVSEFDDIRSCQENTTRAVDLTIILDHDIKDSSGNVIHSKGKTVNPLDYRDMRRDYFFLDVDNLTQVKMFIQEAANRPMQPMAIAGNLSHFYENVKRNGIEIPAGKSTQLMLDRFQIRCAPTLVRQKGKMLEVIEYQVEDVK